MKSKGIYPFFILLSAVVALTLPGMAEENVAIYGHVSFVEDQATVIRTDQAEDKAVVNLPLVPGDTVVTGTNGRCELQFDNGTVIRLDKNSSLRITTVQAPALSSKWKITTLHLLQGQLYTLPQTYNDELFQVITPNAAVKLPGRTAATIRINGDLSTSLFSDSGKFQVMYGADGGTLKETKVKSGQAFVVNVDNVLAPSSEKRNLEFVAWNEYVDRHFKALHSGISKLPPQLKFGNSVLRDWAINWSPVFGAWIYDEFFGYVWRPAHEGFAHFAGPFFDADYFRINGRLFLVPRESWGWVPAHMGTWVWLKNGWTWLPGNWFHSGVYEFFAQNGCFFPSFNFYFWYVYGGFDLYNIYYRYGNDAWRENYFNQFHRHHKKPPVKDLPEELQRIIRRINKAPLNVVSELLKTARLQSGLEARKMVLPAMSTGADFSSRGPASVPPATAYRSQSRSSVAENDMAGKDKIRAAGDWQNKAGRDWNPDSRWAEARGYSIRYSSSRNAVLCPELNLSSDRDHLPNQAGADRYGMPARGYIPENTAPPASSGPGADANATQSITTQVQAEKKDGSGK
jgi:hypothetical protein